ncbi:DUF2336 domain-containing protein [Bradyrhizobium lablabi]|uniref:DUF2336 domain-containing protein n=1 Tax=Bradyrhizobium lablabi TaxID=722472 RepID=UPI001BA9E595|nr:DUF2336 domain-containing protein [Bradyrhizobium lablabi]MBR1122838.1 DUF2336 domain-containing protein [Bradyrhizobium lablabi]
MTASFLEELDEAIRNGTPESRERALWYATDLLMVGRFTDDEIWVFGEVIGRLAVEIEFAARARLAAKLCRIDHAPGQVLDKLASDEAIEVAGPVLRYSERLDVRTLLNTANTRDQCHLLAISRRRSIPEPVSDVLVTRGDRAVAQSVAVNEGARLSEAGFLALIRRSENDGILAENVGLRQDIPRHLFQQLIAKASDETRRKLERERPELAVAVDAFVADATASLHSKFGPASPRYYAAKKAVSFKHRLGELQESSILEYARARRTEEAIVGLTLLCALPSDVVERALAETSRELLLILAKAHEFSWDTTAALLFLGAPHFTISSHELDELKEQFARLHVSSSQEILAHYRDRKSRLASCAPRRLPEMRAF